MRTSTISIWIIILIILGGFIYWALPHPTAQPVSQTATTTPAAAATVMLGSNAQFQRYLEAANGMALYTYKNDKQGVSTCTGLCATAWPPYTVASGASLSAGPGVSGMLGTITRPDGTMQVTYNGMPLYFWARDTSPGQVTGNNVNGFSLVVATSTSQ